MSRRGHIAVLSVALLCAFAGARAQSPGAGASVSATRQAVEAATTAFHQALRTNNAEGLFSYVADGVVVMPPGEAPVRGIAAMRTWYAGFLSQFRTSSLTLTEREVFTGKDWAVEVGAYEWALKPVAGGEPVIDRGHYMQVWKSQPGGRWRFAREIWNSSGPPPTTQEK